MNLKRARAVKTKPLCIIKTMARGKSTKSAPKEKTVNRRWSDQAAQKAADHTQKNRDGERVAHPKFWYYPSDIKKGRTPASLGGCFNHWLKKGQENDIYILKDGHGVVRAAGNPSVLKNSVKGFPSISKSMVIINPPKASLLEKWSKAESAEDKNKIMRNYVQDQIGDSAFNDVSDELFYAGPSEHTVNYFYTPADLDVLAKALRERIGGKRHYVVDGIEKREHGKSDIVVSLHGRVLKLLEQPKTDRKEKGSVNVDRVLYFGEKYRGVKTVKDHTKNIGIDDAHSVGGTPVVDVMGITIAYHSAMPNPERYIPDAVEKIWKDDQIDKVVFRGAPLDAVMKELNASMAEGRRLYREKAERKPRKNKKAKKEKAKERVVPTTGKSSKVSRFTRSAAPTGTYEDVDLRDEGVQSSERSNVGSENASEDEGFGEANA